MSRGGILVRTVPSLQLSSSMERAVRITIVIPSYRGCARVTRTVEQLSVALPTACGAHAVTWDVLIVDDGSPPPEQHVLRQWAHRRIADHVAVSTVCLPANRGQQEATIIGCALATGDIIVTMDDDGAHPAAVAVAMVECLLVHARLQVVYAAPVDPHISLVRRLGTRANNALFSLFAHKPWRVPVTSFRAMHRSLVQRALELPVSYPYLSAMIFALRPHVGVVRYRSPVVHKAGRASSRYSIRRLVTIFWGLLVFWGPLRPIGRRIRRPIRYDVAGGCP